MTKAILFCLTAALFVYSCNDSATETKEATKDSTSTANTAMPHYPYTIDHPDNWEMGNTANTMVALSALKGFENGNIEESMKYFGDSVRLQFDGLDKTVPNDSLKTMFTSMRSQMKSLEVKMEDWESVVSKDKEEEWVTFWYTQRWEDTNGKKDSASFVNDLKLKDGKIIRLDEYTRKLH